MIWKVWFIGDVMFMSCETVDVYFGDNLVFRWWLLVQWMLGRAHCARWSSTMLPDRTERLHWLILTWDRCVVPLKIYNNCASTDLVEQDFQTAIYRALQAHQHSHGCPLLSWSCINFLYASVFWCFVHIYIYPFRLLFHCNAQFIISKII